MKRTRHGFQNRDSMERALRKQKFEKQKAKIGGRDKGTIVYLRSSKSGVGEADLFAVERVA